LLQCRGGNIGMVMPGVSDVEELYQLYPKHVGGRAAIRAIQNAMKRLSLELKLAGKQVGDQAAWMKERVSVFAESPAGQRGRLTPYPSTWFNQSRYLDDQDVWWEITPK